MRRAPQWVIEKLIRDAAMWIRIHYDGPRPNDHWMRLDSRGRAAAVYIAAEALAGHPDGWMPIEDWLDAMERACRGPWDGVMEAACV